MNTKAFKIQVLSLSDQLFPMVARMLGNSVKAEDALQDIMLKLWSKRKELGKHPNVPGFVFLTARYHCLDLLKKKGFKLEDIDLQYLLVSSNKGSDRVEWEELNAHVRHILEDLPEQQRQVMIYRDLDGLEFTEIASLCNLKLEHARVLLSRARKQVAKELNKIYCYEPQ